MAHTVHYIPVHSLCKRNLKSKALPLALDLNLAEGVGHFNQPMDLQSGLESQLSLIGHLGVKAQANVVGNQRCLVSIFLVFCLSELEI